MKNNSFTNIKPGDIVYVYTHSSERITKAHVLSVTGRQWDRFNMKFNAYDIEFFFLNRGQQDTLNSETTIHTFYVELTEEKNRRGSVYTGFMTLDDAKEFKRHKLENQLEDAELSIKRIREKIKSIDTE